MFQGYLFISVLISGNSELIQLIVQSIKNDLASRYYIDMTNLRKYLNIDQFLGTQCTFLWLSSALPTLDPKTWQKLLVATSQSCLCLGRQ